jgi:hypothetical protein
MLVLKERLHLGALLVAALNSRGAGGFAVGDGAINNVSVSEDKKAICTGKSGSAGLFQS